MGTSTSNARLNLQPINRVINGGMDYWQRNVTFNNAADFVYLADRFQNRKSAGVTSTINVSRSTDVASDSSSEYSMLIDNTTASAALGVNDVYAIRHAIEGSYIQDLYSNEVTIKFKVKANHTATYGISLHNNTLFSGDTQYITYDISAVNTWETKTIKLDMSNQTYVSGNGVGLDIWFTMAAGTTSWQGGAIGNFVGTAGNSIQIADVMVYDSSHGDLEFQRAGQNIVDELALCRRYFEKSYNLNDEIGKNNTAFSGVYSVSESFTSGASINYTIDFGEYKRNAPVISVYDPVSGSLGVMRDSSNTLRTVLIQALSERGAVVTNNTTVLSNNGHSFHWTADAEF